MAERAADSGNWVEEYTAVVALPAAPSLIRTPTPVSPPAPHTNGDAEVRGPTRHTRGQNFC
ncbi:hypothetical protein [Microbacterium sp. 22296]|uniref:hypothetical protein n=1 Tax=Microbacterium sp. 22296 TaxID=3453903 RepID=UPI003F855825